MCEFISWKKYKGKLWFLTDDVVQPRLEEFKAYNRRWQDDLLGHGAIEWFYNLPPRCGTNRECTDFSSPVGFPSEIVDAIKSGRFTLIGRAFDILTKQALAEYKKIAGQAWAEYKKIEGQAWAEYEKITGPALAEYKKIRGPALAEYEKIAGPAWAEYKKITGQALAEYEKIEGQALAEYKKITGQAFWKIARLKKNRRKEWQ